VVFGFARIPKPDQAANLGHDVAVEPDQNVVLDPANSDRLIVTTEDGTLGSDDGGKSWARRSTRTVCSPGPRVTAFISS
jgi:hypothetical protein